MKSVIIRVARSGTPNDFALNPQTHYISLFGTKPEVSFPIQCGQYKLLQMLDQLRYREADPRASSKAIAFFNELATKFFEDLQYLDIDKNNTEPLHIRLVMSPLELSQIPFEFSLFPNQAGEGKPPMLANPVKVITLTREVRQESDSYYLWPSVPRILFLWTEPDPEMPVPHVEHLRVLEKIVQPYAKPKQKSPNPAPDMGQFLTVLPNATIDQLRKHIKNAVDAKKPYTHIHILGHGITRTSFGLTEFRLMFHKKDDPDRIHKVDGSTLAKALIVEESNYKPAVVSLMVCDSGNTSNPILPTGSIAYQLHTHGIPCVFASQFPLNQSASTILVNCLYSEFLQGNDPRMALYKARMELIDEQPHDWASLVAYARFPENIDEQLVSARLKLLFNSMKITNSWVDHVLKYWDRIEDGQKISVLKDIEMRLGNSILDLSNHLNEDNESELEDKPEHFGLLASAYKRKAEFLFRSISIDPDRESELLKKSAEALNTAKEFYNSGQDADPSSHWNTMQYLALKAVSEGNLADNIEHWYVTKRMAENDEQKSTEEEDKVWSWGTLAELHMLQPLIISAEADNEIISAAVKKSAAYLEKITKSDAKYNYAKESTARQLERYLNWWPSLYPKAFPGWLKIQARQLREILPSLEKLMTSD